MAYGKWSLVGLLAASGILFAPAFLLLWPLAALLAWRASRRSRVWPEVLGCLNGLAALLLGLALSLGLTDPCKERPPVPGQRRVYMSGCTQPAWEPYLVAGSLLAVVTLIAYLALARYLDDPEVNGTAQDSVDA